VSRLEILHPSPRFRTQRAHTAGGRSKALARAGVLGLASVVIGCASGPPDVPPPRPIVIHSGARIRADHDRMRKVYEWVTREETNINDDPSFWIIGQSTINEVFPWDGLRISNDTATVQIPLGGNDASLVYQIYGHLHLMVTMGRQEEWLPEAPSAVGYELERAILKRCADAWVLGRTVFDTQPFGPMDELAYASESGFLDAFIFTARPDEFAVSRTAWARENPERTEEYRDWFIETFNREPPGLRSD
jgi:hypothetical protein